MFGCNTSGDIIASYLFLLKNYCPLVLCVDAKRIVMWKLELEYFDVVDRSIHFSNHIQRKVCVLFSIGRCRATHSLSIAVHWEIIFLIFLRSMMLSIYIQPQLS